DEQSMDGPFRGESTPSPVFESRAVNFRVRSFVSPTIAPTSGTIEFEAQALCIAGNVLGISWLPRFIEVTSVNEHLLEPFCVSAEKLCSPLPETRHPLRARPVSPAEHPAGA